MAFVPMSTSASIAFVPMSTSALALEHILHIDMMLVFDRASAPAVEVLQADFDEIRDVLVRQHFFKSAKRRPRDWLELLRTFSSRLRRSSGGAVIS
jgi:hypothetical protein